MGIARVRSIGTEITREAETKRRELKADYLRATEGNGPADDVLLDLRDHRQSLEGPTAGPDDDGFDADGLPSSIRRPAVAVGGPSGGSQPAQWPGSSGPIGR